MQSFTDSFLAGLTKTALTRLRRHIQAMPAEQRAQAIQRLPGQMQQTQAYKELGGRAADVVRAMPGEAGHGAQHVFGVTRQARGLLTRGAQPAPQQVQRHATMGAMLHDVTREPAFHQEQAMGRQEFKKHPELFHSMTGGQAAQQFLGGTNAPLTQMAKINPQNVVRNVQAHDTDAHKAFPALKARTQTSQSGHALYTADKLEGLGAPGMQRTLAVGKAMGETPRETGSFGVRQAWSKYRPFIKQNVPAEQQPEQRKRLLEYVREAQRVRRTPVATPQPTQAAPAAKTASFGDSAKRIKAAQIQKGQAFAHPPFVRLLRWAAASGLQDKQVTRVVGKALARRGNTADAVAELFRAVFNVHPKHRARFSTLLEPAALRTNFKRH